MLIVRGDAHKYLPHFAILFIYATQTCPYIYHLANALGALGTFNLTDTAALQLQELTVNQAKHFYNSPCFKGWLAERVAARLANVQGAHECFVEERLTIVEGLKAYNPSLEQFEKFVFASAVLTDKNKVSTRPCLLEKLDRLQQMKLVMPSHPLLIVEPLSVATPNVAEMKSDSRLKAASKFVGCPYDVTRLQHGVLKRLLRDLNKMKALCTITADINFVK